MRFASYGPLSFFVLVPSISCLSCSAYIDEFTVTPDGSVESSPSDGTVAPHGSDPSGDQGIIQCGRQVTPPSGDPIEFCAIDEGTFSMGCDPSSDTCMDDELPRHEVRISAYRIQRYETTVAEFRSFITAVPEWSSDGTASVQCDLNYLGAWDENTPPGGSLGTPITEICWYAADAFCKWLGNGYRLPTEAEWERAARGTSAGTDSAAYRIYPFDADPVCATANFNGCEGAPAKVGSRTGLSFGALYDMGGNAWEWVADWYGDLYYCDPAEAGGHDLTDCDESYAWNNPRGPASASHKVVRGGSWFHDINMMRAAKREHLAPEFSSNMAGFRCAFSD